jgi:flavin reductase (DIM6/NTAB) family NADH-FMN oxidoreductase RutF
MIETSGVFTVSFLEKSQTDIAELFFKPQAGTGARFGEIDYYLGEQSGCPILTSALGFVECEVRGKLEGGDHSVFLGEVVGAGVHREGDPLWLSDTSWQYGG